MKKNIALISVLAILLIASSGCVGNKTPQANGTGSDNLTKANAISSENVSEISKIKNLPAGFEYVGSPSLSTDEIKTNYKTGNVSGILEGAEGLYKGSNNTDFYLDVIKLENKESANNFISAYTSSFQPLNGIPRFVEEAFNGHNATRITTVITEAGNESTRYIYVWDNENYVLAASGSTNNSTVVRQFAESTGY